MKRNSLLLLLLCTVVGGYGWAEESVVELEATRIGERFAFLLTVSDVPPGEILDALHDGMRSEVEFTVQLYREVSGVWRFFGDRLVDEYETRRIAYFDPFTRSYRIDSHGAFNGGEQSFGEPEAFLEAFLSLESTLVPLPEAGSGYHLRARSVVRPVRVAPPLGLMGIFLPHEQYGSSWVSAEL